MYSQYIFLYFDFLWCFAYLTKENISNKQSEYITCIIKYNNLYMYRVYLSIHQSVHMYVVLVRNFPKYYAVMKEHRSKKKIKSFYPSDRQLLCIGAWPTQKIIKKKIYTKRFEYRAYIPHTTHIHIMYNIKNIIFR